MESRTLRSMAAPMSDEHKAALALGREQSRAVRRYLEALEEARVLRDRSPATIRREIEAVTVASGEADALLRAQLLQLRRNLEEEFRQCTAIPGPRTVEADFLAAARAYGERKGISYAAWREVGVSAEVLERAGIREERHPRSRRDAPWLDDDDADDGPLSLTGRTPAEAFQALLGDQTGAAREPEERHGGWSPD